MGISLRVSARYLEGVGVEDCSAFGRYCFGIGEPGNHFW
jgi:hypothetical protein